MRVLPEPTWARLGFSEAPDFTESGKNMGIVIIDTITPHPALQHLGDRLQYVTVHDDFSITCRNIALEESLEHEDASGEHGLMTLLALSHKPFVFQGKTHIGIAPAAHYIVLNHGAFKTGEGERLKAGIEWILNKQKEWNIRIILSTGWHALDHQVYLKSTSKNSTVQALASAVRSGVLVVCANGNTRTANMLPPREYLAVGGYNDRGHAERHIHVPFPDEPYGRNAEGHFRPDVLAPRVYLTVPSCEFIKKADVVSYYEGTSGAATLVTGVAAYLMSTFQGLDAATLRTALTTYGDRIHGYDNLAPRVNVAKTKTAIELGQITNQPQGALRSLRIRDTHIALHSQDDIKRAISLSTLVERQLCSRNLLWQYSFDRSPIVRKIAVCALEKPINEYEREVFWERLAQESEGGVRGWYAYALLQDARKNEGSKWIPLSTDINWTVRWCVSEYLAMFPDFFPQFEPTHDPDSIISKASPLIQWLSGQTE
ncbi:S8 family serine peptidase [Paenibacillus lautus]|uniref:S8 family serine peptidase n=1 Tax=Paenibacillus lautus TaxID=1401 RepID=UPI001C7D021B|nr:S8 family serine peptidase [Paenibacillus lautus]MBX4148184.1 S8 family serine peptidase [Paenibacillus lautus]